MRCCCFVIFLTWFMKFISIDILSGNFSRKINNIVDLIIWIALHELHLSWTLVKHIELAHRQGVQYLFDSFWLQKNNCLMKWKRLHWAQHKSLHLFCLFVCYLLEVILSVSATFLPKNNANRRKQQQSKQI